MSTDHASGNSEGEASAAGFLGSPVMSVLLSLGALITGAAVYALGRSSDQFRWDTFVRGGAVFLMLVGGILLAGVGMSLIVRLLVTVSPASLRFLSERRRLKDARRRALGTIHRRRDRQEEQARLTAVMQASYLYERESARVSNAQALKEFRKALQTGVVNSCEVVFDHLNRTVEQYEQVIHEIEQSALETDEKTELLNQLSRQLDVSALDQRHRAAQRLMEDAIWRVRLRKARILARRDADAARRYLNSVRTPETGHRILIQIHALLNELR